MFEEKREVDNRLHKLKREEEERNAEEIKIRQRLDLLKRKEQHMELERQWLTREEELRLERLDAMKRRQKQIQEDRRREEALNELKAEEDRMERIIREREVAESRHRERLERLALEEQGIRRELLERKVGQDELLRKATDASRDNSRTSVRPDNCDRIRDWEFDVSLQAQQNPEEDRLAVLVETERKVAKAIQDEMRRKYPDDVTEAGLTHRPTVAAARHPQISSETPQGPIYIKPTVNAFSGTEPVPKSESSFDVWSLEVECLLKTHMYPEYLVNQAIRNSLKGEAKRVLLPLGPMANSQEIIDKMESVFGNVASGESVLQRFYTTRQGKDETVTSWGLRLEELLRKAITKGQIQIEQRNEMLRIKFWRGLFSDALKNATRVFFETEHNFEQLRKKIRTEVCEMDTERVDSAQQPRTEVTIQKERSIQQKQIQQIDKDQNMLKDLLARMERMEKKIEEVKRPPQNEGGSQPRNSYYNRRGNGSGQDQNSTRNVRNPPNANNAHLNR